VISAFHSVLMMVENSRAIYGRGQSFANWAVIIVSAIPSQADRKM
jgi:hypothetical protein